jgi:hypothetical protein
MQSKEAVCTGRERFWTEKDAYAAAAKVPDDHHFRSPSLRAYICGECIGWHLTTQPKINLN